MSEAIKQGIVCLFIILSLSAFGYLIVMGHYIVGIAGLVTFTLLPFLRD